MEIISYGDNAIILQFEKKIAVEIHRQIMNYAEAIKKFSSVDYVIPAYTSLTVVFNNDIKKTELIEKIDSVNLASYTKMESATVEVPVCYDEEFALDMTEVEAETGLHRNDIISIHSTHDFLVFMMGFIPGFPYLGKLPQKLEVKRRSVVRRGVPAGSVGIAGQQSGIYPDNSSGGWKIIGRTPLKLFDSKYEEPFLLKAGDTVRFKEISKDKYYSMLEKDYKA